VGMKERLSPKSDLRVDYKKDKGSRELCFPGTNCNFIAIDS
jgi:hypothetical protein